MPFNLLHEGSVTTIGHQHRRGTTVPQLEIWITPRSRSNNSFRPTSLQYRTPVEFAAQVWQSAKCVGWYARKALDTAHIVRDAMLRQLPP